MKTFIIIPFIFIAMITFIFMAIIAYMNFSRFIALLFLDDFNMELVKRDYHNELDDYGLENLRFMLMWPIIIIQWVITKIMK